SIDYVYTDPPYGAHIAYLDLSTMWAAWLELGISLEDRAQEVIEGGDLQKTRDDYQALLTQSLQQMHEVLKPGAWMSMVFAHRDTTYWDALVNACGAAGFQYANTVVQPVGVVWSMHKKKNPLRVLSGELVLNFRKPAAKTVAVKSVLPPRDPLELVRVCCESVIISKVGATTEDLHHAVVPKLLEAGVLGAFSKQHGDLVPVLQSHFDFDSASGKWQLRANDFGNGHASGELARYEIARFLALRYSEGNPAKEMEVQQHVRVALKRNGALNDKTISRLLHEVGACPDGN